MHRWKNHVSHPRRLHAMSVRARVESGIRQFFGNQNFIETKTPLLVASPGMEPHIRPYRALSNRGTAYLPTSPEFSMKKLLVGGLERIFQICPAFRDEPISPQHSPEFTLLEWYRANSGYEAIMTDTENLFEDLATQIHGAPLIHYQGKKISVKTPWPRLSIRDLFSQMAGVDLASVTTREAIAEDCSRLKLPINQEDTWDDLYFKIWLNIIEPRLPDDRATIVMRYPSSQAALAVVDTDPDGTKWAKRFEVYAGGLELGNAFEELTDPIEQRRRFVEDMELRNRVYGRSFPPNPIDEDFLQALEEGLPPSGGIAIGVDRMVMLLADEPELAYTQWLPSFCEFN